MKSSKKNKTSVKKTPELTLDGALQFLNQQVKNKKGNKAMNAFIASQLANYASLQEVLKPVIGQVMSSEGANILAHVDARISEALTAIQK